MAKPYRMTARRRAALRRAQAASARKRKLRRRRIVAGVGIGVTTAGLGVAVYGAHTVSKIGRAGSWESRPGMPVHNKKIIELRGRKNTVKPRKGVFKVGPTKKHGGNWNPPAPQYIARHRPAYDAKRRAEYAKARKATQGKRIRSK